MPLFKRGRASLNDDLVTGRPKSATDEETVLKVYHVMIMKTVLLLKLGEIAKKIGISERTVRTVLTRDLVYEKNHCPLSDNVSYTFR
jgi:hypothetical protein